jgi:predicted nucleic acid-binding protein
MSGHKYLADTNTFIFLLDKHPALKSLLDSEWSYSFNQITIELRQQYKMKTPDVIIAASSLFRNIPLLTFDKGFTVIKKLDLVLLEP